MTSTAWRLSETQLRGWLDALIEGDHDVIAPVLEDGVAMFAPIRSADRAVLTASGKTRWSPKEFLFPRSETLYSYAVDGGAVSRYVARELAVGETVRVAGPFGVCYLRERHRGPILAIAGGSGMAPMRSIVGRALKAGLAQRIHLYIGMRDERDIYLERELADLAARHRNLEIDVVLSEPSGPTARLTP